MLLRIRVLLLFIVAIQLSGLGQNPFEIQPRIESMVSPNKSLDSIASGIDLIERSVRTVPGEVDFEPIKIESQNPFEVSHIPLRKNNRKGSLSPEEFTKEKEDYLDRNIPLFIIILSVIIIAIIIGLKDNIIIKAIKANYNANYLKLVKADAFSLSLRTYLLLYTLFFINLALAVSHIFSMMGQNIGIITVLSVLLSIYLIRHISLWLLGFVFDGIKTQASEYNFSIQIGNILIGMVLLPLNIIMIYGFPSWFKFFAVLVLLILIAAYALRLLRSTKLTASFLFTNRLHFFLYLCACEFGPILIFSKFILGII